MADPTLYGSIIVAHEEDLAGLTPEERAAVLARLSAGRKILRRLFVRPKAHFTRACAWTFAVFSWDLAAQSEFAPVVDYTATMAGLTSYVDARERDAEAETVLEDDEP